MKKFNQFLNVSLMLLVGPPCCAQGMMEGMMLRGAGAGLGAGTAASLNKGKVVRRSVESVLSAQQAALAQTKMIEQYVTAGCQHLAEKRWQEAEQYFHYALQIIARRDGPGSPKSAPVLEHLVQVKKGQNKLDEAIDYQKRVVAFAGREKMKDPHALLSAQTMLSGIYMQKGDYRGAEVVLEQSADLVRKDPGIGSDRVVSTLRSYGKVLRELKKNVEADSIELELAKNANPVAKVQAVSTAKTLTGPSIKKVFAKTSEKPAKSPEISRVSAAADTILPSKEEIKLSLPTEGSGSVHSADLADQTNKALGTSEGISVSKPEGSSEQLPGQLLPPPTAEWPVLNESGILQPAAVPEQSPNLPQQSPDSAPSSTSEVVSTPPSSQSSTEVKDANVKILPADSVNADVDGLKQSEQAAPPSSSPNEQSETK